jgi:hypothetical protein
MVLTAHGSPGDEVGPADPAGFFHPRDGIHIRPNHSDIRCPFRVDPVPLISRGERRFEPSLFRNSLIAYSARFHYISACG